ncbi:unnamed protein product [Pedinophyceae sp. YPF-701]|nr:unnamed protein product [Pedinophyceae sp. YPF-701]
MAAVLESCETACWTATREEVGVQVHEKLRGEVPRDTAAFVGWPEHHGGISFYRRTGSDAQDPSCVELIGRPATHELDLQILRPSSITPDMTGLRWVEARVLREVGDCDNWLPENVAAGITTLCIRGSDVRCIPPGMAKLDYLEVSSCSDLNPDELLPATSCAQLQSLYARSMEIRRLPDMPELELLQMTDSFGLSDSFLPCSSVSRLRNLTLNGADVERLPAGLVALEKLDLSLCKNLDVDGFLPESSRARLRQLDASQTLVRRVPDNMPALEELRIRWCDALLDGDDWLPWSSRERLRAIQASNSSVSRIPKDMPALELLYLEACPLVADFLPASSAGRITELNAEGSSLARLPPGMRALEELRINRCEHLDEDFLPPSSAARLRELLAWGSALRKLPRGLAALEELDVRECELLDEDMDADAAARLKAWEVSGSNLRLPEGFRS